MGIPRWLSGKESICNAGHVGLIAGWGRSSGKGNGNPHQYSWLENSMDRGACQLQSRGSQRLRFIWSLYLVWGINIILSPPPNVHPLISVSSTAQLYPTLFDPMDCSTPGLHVHHQFPELIQTHVHWVSDATQPSHPLSSPSLPTFNLSQHQGLFKWVSSGQSIGVSASISILPVNIQDWFPLGWTGLLSLQFKGLSTVFSNTTVPKHQFFCAQLSL